LERFGDDSQKDDQVKTQLRYHDDGTAGWKIQHKTLTEWMSSPPFVITGLSTVNKDGRDLVRVEFDGQGWEEDVRTQAAGAPKRLNQGFVLFDPASFWVERELQLAMGNGNTIDCGFEYDQGQDGIPILKKLTSEFVKTPKGNWIGTTETVTYETQHEVVPPSEFQLSYFGLPEPDIGGNWLRWPIMLYVNAAIICAVIAALFLWRRRRTMLAH
jgi:hypothetical protein